MKIGVCSVIRPKIDIFDNFVNEMKLNYDWFKMKPAEIKVGNQYYTEVNFAKNTKMTKNIAILKNGQLKFGNSSVEIAP